MGYSDPRRHLIEGLVGLKHRDLYLNRSTFHAQIEVMTQMLPIVVDALAVAATEEKAKVDAEIKRQMMLPPARICMETAVPGGTRRWGSHE